ncbi:developmental checkpoint coupling sporulation initiation to replication initiation [Alkalicoccobacillus murimartini]|uniref:Developmental checkpoint coupling sporulation initiation to replication initiation n=1 Tax=Alkalicoccobacillus murimartini TaxID=171685 RepID=A0ABT9YCG2_9BACI|nr:developmental checkpoint coupling sporulation initiation to replication initiation [Alkalicoccobacillus murimartini]
MDIPSFKGGDPAASKQQDKMKHLSDDLLIETYYKAIELELSNEFVELIKLELMKRSLEAKIKLSS